MIPLRNKENVTPPDSAFPFADIKNDTGNGDGTPVNRQVYGDLHQFFEKMMNESGIVPNGVPDSQANGFQLYEALLAVINTLLQPYQQISEKGSPNGYAQLGADGLVPSSILPAFVDDVLEFPTLGDFPNPGETGKIYVALDTNNQYRWSGTTYIQTNSNDVNSVFGRTGAIIAAANDYTAAQIAFTAYLTITGTDAQTAIQQLKDELDALLSADQKAALGGTSGTPSASNQYVTDSDGRLFTDDATKTKVETVLDDISPTTQGVPYLQATSGGEQNFNLGVNGVTILNLKDNSGNRSFNLPIGIPFNIGSPELTQINYQTSTILLNGWSGRVYYGYSTDGRVVFIGRGINANSSGVSTFFTLPAGYRPAFDREYHVTIRAGSALEPARMQINDLGGCSVSLLDGSGALTDMRPFEVTIERQALPT